MLHRCVNVYNLAIYRGSFCDWFVSSPAMPPSPTARHWLVSWPHTQPYVCRCENSIAKQTRLIASTALTHCFRRFRTPFWHFNAVIPGTLWLGGSAVNMCLEGTRFERIWGKRLRKLPSLLFCLYICHQHSLLCAALYSYAVFHSFFDTSNNRPDWVCDTLACNVAQVGTEAGMPNIIDTLWNEQGTPYDPRKHVYPIGFFGPFCGPKSNVLAMESK